MDKTPRNGYSCNKLISLAYLMLLAVGLKLCTSHLCKKKFSQFGEPPMAGGHAMLPYDFGPRQLNCLIKTSYSQITLCSLLNVNPSVVFCRRFQLVSAIIRRRLLMQYNIDKLSTVDNNGIVCYEIEVCISENQLELENCPRLRIEVRPTAFGG